MANQDQHQSNGSRAATIGCFYAVAAYGSYGLMPIYVKAVGHVSAPEILAHRIVWGALFLAALLVVSGGLSQVGDIVRSRRQLLILLTSALLNAVNMGAFIWAVSIERVTDSSLGYFMAPLVSVLLGMVVLKERLRRWQGFAVLLAVAGVAYLTYALGVAPWISLVIAFSWGFYGLVHKISPVEPLSGLTVEMAVLTPFFLGFLVWIYVQGGGGFARIDTETDALLALAGLTIGLPLLWFVSATKRLRLTTVGLFQYIGPSLNLLLAVAVYDEPLTRAHVVAFALIWTALVIYTADSRRRRPPS
jgi:chloramphenicol-sensitive protein RarD